MDPKIYQSMVDHANKVVWKSPDVQVIDPSKEGFYPPLAQVLQSTISDQERRKKLILPDLSAFDNETVFVLSDFAGEGSGNYYTYSFLLCSWNFIEMFAKNMEKLRAESGLGTREISFKEFNSGSMQRILPDYLRLLDMITGFLFTVVIEKKIVSVFGENTRETRTKMAAALEDVGLGKWKPETAEKLGRVVHIGAFLATLLAELNQKIFWMTDNDNICANKEMHQAALALFERALRIYGGEEAKFPLLGGALPFAERHLGTLDLLSATDVTASSVEHYMTLLDKHGNKDFQVKGGSHHVLRWLTNDGLGMKKMTIIIRDVKGKSIQGGTLQFSLIDPPSEVTCIPVVI